MATKNPKRVHMAQALYLKDCIAGKVKIEDDFGSQ